MLVQKQDMSLKKYKQHDKNATMKRVKAKINSLRLAYNKEVEKVKELAKKGTGRDEVKFT